MSDVHTMRPDANDEGDLEHFGYLQSLRRTLGPYGSFAVAFSMISITTAIFFLLPSLFGTAGAAGVWLWIPCAAGVFLIVLVYAHLAARIPITGFAYQWNSRLINPHYGWFTGYTALLAFIAGTAATAVALASVFASDIWTSPTHGDIVLFATVAMAVAALINIISIRAVSAVNNTGVFFEITGSVGAAALLFVGAWCPPSGRRAERSGTASCWPRCSPCTASSAGRAPRTWPKRRTTPDPSPRSP